MADLKNVLIWFHENEIEAKGGPAGYLNNIREYLDDNDIKFEFLPDKNIINLGKNSVKKNIRNKLKFILDIYTMKKIIKYSYSNIIDVNKYDIIHFHNTKELYWARNILKEYKGKVIITSHSPKPFHLEVIEDELRLSKLQKKLFKNVINKFDEFDKFAFERADYIIFPCKDAEEPYLKNWEWYSQFIKQNKSKYKYIPSGIKPVKCKVDKIEIMNKYNIPQNSKILCYVGRHNETKGYDRLKIIGERILEKYDNVYVLVAGKENPLKGLNHPRWIEVGWTNDPYSIINASDIFILPNKETYFDLILLEVISIGKNVLLSRTGGNKYFMKYINAGLFYFNDEEEAVNQLDKLLKLDDNKIEELEKNNRIIYETNFKTQDFVKKYKSVLKDIR